MHDISEAEKICDCGEHLMCIGEEVSEQLRYIPSQISVIQHVRPKYACKPCQENVKIAPMPVLLLPKSIATPELVAHVIISKYCDHLPLYRQETIWERMEIDMPRSSLCDWVLKTADLCEPLIKLLQKNIIDHDYAQVDETTVQVLNEVGRDPRTKSYMWVYRGGGHQSEARYQLRQEKSAPILDAFKKWLDHHLPKTSEQRAIGKAIRYCLAHWSVLNNHLQDGRIEIDNNLIENAIRPFAIGRKNWLFSGSPSGAKAGATFFSLIETCKANNVEPYRYLCAMLNRIRECATEEDYRKLLPQFIQF